MATTTDEALLELWARVQEQRGDIKARQQWFAKAFTHLNKQANKQHWWCQRTEGKDGAVAYGCRGCWGRR